MRSPSAFQVGCAVVLVASAARTLAQPESVVRVDPVVVAETPLTADAGGTSQLRLDANTAIQLRSLTNVADNVANLHINASGAGSYGGLISLRGLVNTPYFSDPSVAVYFDDLPLGNSFTYPTELFGFGTATVVRGPQPAVAGRTAEGGLIQFSSGLAGDVPTGSLRAAIGNFDARRGAFDARSARGEQVDATVSGAYAERHGYIENTQLGQRVDDQQVMSGAARVRIRPSPTSEIALQLLANSHRDGSQPLVPLSGPLFTVARGREGSTDSDFIGEALKLSFDTSAGRLSATTSHTWWNLDPYDNRLVLPPTLDSRLSQRQTAWNEELRLASAAAGSVAWHLGAWFSDLKTDGTVKRSIPGLFPIEGSAFSLKSRTGAAFGDLSLHPAANWTLAGALRVESVSRDFDRTQTIPAPGYYTASQTHDAVLPRVSAEYAFNRDTHATLAAAFGAKPGGWSAYTDKANLARFSPEHVASVEAGVDTLLAARTVKIAARVFDYEIRDYQIERSFNATDYLVVNAPHARSLGGELETSWRPISALTITGTLGLTNTTLREFNDPFTGKSYAGRRAPYAPAYDAHVAIAYHAGSGLFAMADATAIGRTFYDESENPAFASPAHITGNAQLGYDSHRWSVTIYAENIADAHYTTLIIPGVGHQVPGAPRTYGVEMAWKW